MSRASEGSFTDSSHSGEGSEDDDTSVPQEHGYQSGRGSTRESDSTARFGAGTDSSLTASPAMTARADSIPDSVDVAPGNMSTRSANTSDPCANTVRKSSLETVEGRTNTIRKSPLVRKGVP